MANSLPPGTPAAELAVDAALARRLLVAHHRDLAELPIRLVASGWDNVMFRLGDDLAMRLPRRAVAAPLIVHEQRYLPLLADRLPLRIPAPVRIGIATDEYPWPWSVLPWLEGETADLSLPDNDQSEVLAAFFEALHRPAPTDVARNPYRGVPLNQRLSEYDRRTASLARRGVPLDPAAVAIWNDALAAPNDAAPTWIQGDMHPRNVLVVEGRVTAVIDWGDVAQGDRASDLAGIWMLFADIEARRRAMAACRTVSHDTWRRARGWAVLYGVMLRDAGLADDPRMAAIGAATLERVVAGP